MTMPKKQEKAVVFQGEGYQIIRADPRNLELHVLRSNGEGEMKYQFAGYYPTIERCLGSIVRNGYLVDETKTHDMKSYLKAMESVRESILCSIRNHLETNEPEVNDIDDDLFN
jgi:hypothetical protein